MHKTVGSEQIDDSSVPQGQVIYIVCIVLQEEMKLGLYYQVWKALPVKTETVCVIVR